MIEWAIIAILWVLGGYGIRNGCILAEASKPLIGQRANREVLSKGFGCIVYLLWPFILLATIFGPSHDR